MVENQFSIGDLVAHKHYPEKAIGRITQFYASGRVGVDDGCRPRSFLRLSMKKSWMRWLRPPKASALNAVRTIPALTVTIIATVQTVQNQKVRTLSQK
ncbi:hypothetical protein [Kamptonema sp. UHCC 0994]|uniref:hypothetical protein n=1 Tax=Kamptonema sp. UHCC 0994 TaxID=3031329 RepID=UPI0023BA9EDB|nr:hypothetical protein [Kamptonema sp. UHCC 0994]MDF0556678.1 hypothetical protein [Kamptonema sp. UHCC 0994]